MKSAIIYFSPTRGGEKIAKAIQSGMNGNDNDELFNISVNHKYITDDFMELTEEIPVVFVIPVYGGHIPKIAAERLDKIRGKNNQPAVIVVVYGNRAFENALIDLDRFVSERGFNTIAAAAFVCEHSYSNPDTPIASGRPDDKDLVDATEFGRLVKEKIVNRDFTTVDAASLKDEPSPENSLKNFIAFVKNYQAEQSTSPKTYIPNLDQCKCSDCGQCIELCPTEAIREDLSTDPTRCIKCCACVKQCPEEARSFQSPFAKPLSENFSTRKSPRWIL